jgi:hypothetical protein
MTHPKCERHCVPKEDPIVVVFGHENNPLRDPSNEPEPGQAAPHGTFLSPPQNVYELAQ